MNLMKIFRKNSKPIILVTVLAFAMTLVVSIIGTYASLFMGGR